MSKTKKEVARRHPRPAQKKTSAAKKDRRSGVVGVTSDGVTILRPTARPTHFTSKQIRETIREVLAGSAAKR